MKHTYFFFLLFILFQSQIKANTTDFVSSNLPIVIITTDINPSTGSRYTIVDEPKVLATMKIIYHADGNRSFLSDQNNATYLNYNGKIGIEIRGSSSQSLEKKPYGITTLKADGITNNNVSLLGMPKENDWILNSLAFDASLIRDYLSYDLYSDMENYSPRRQYCEVIINGDYKGLYILMEKLKIDDNRINITEMIPSNIAYPDVSGGYIIKSDKTTGNDPVAWTMNSDNGWSVNFIYDNPKPYEIVYQQKNYIYNYFQTLQTRTDENNASITTGFPDIIDLPSFIDFMIMAELSSNVDSYHFSTYYHKDRKGKLRAGPIWDFNLTYGLDVFGGRSLTNVWQFDNDDNEGPRYWKMLYNNPTFKCYLSKRWVELTAAGKPLNKTIIDSKIDNIVAKISEAATRDQLRWESVGYYPNYIASLKSWISTRITWMNTKLSNYTICSNIAVPQLVISKINYHPLEFQDSLEFIEITNNSDKNANLTGIYFRELGVTYRFPNDAVLLPNQNIYLASDSVMFKSYYGLDAYGQFYRNLSDKSEHLVLVDAFGNVIDDVNYADDSPWAPEADGSGSYLQLTDINSDNSLASNWKASNLSLTNVDNPDYTNRVVLFPIPSRDKLHVLGYDVEVKYYEIADLLGRVVKVAKPSMRNTLDVSDLPTNIYVVKIYTSDDKCVVKRVIKN